MGMRTSIDYGETLKQTGSAKKIEGRTWSTQTSAWRKDMDRINYMSAMDSDMIVTKNKHGNPPQQIVLQ